jgi:DNA-directed RNA polymerase specialized sigma subunit
MYKVEGYRIPKDRKYSEFTLELVKKIQENNDDEAKDILFRLTYPLMLKEANKYTDLIPMDEMDAEISLAFLYTLRFIKTTENFSFIYYFNRVLKSQVLKSYYGHGYIKTEENRKRYRNFKKSIISIEETTNNTEAGDESITILDTMIDETVDVENEAINNTLYDTLTDIINRVFATATIRGFVRTEKTKKLIHDYIRLKIENPDATSAEIAKMCETSESNLANIKQRYLPKIKSILIKEGYNI